MSEPNKKSNPIDQIRDIVFGKEMTSYEDRFRQIESLLAEQISQVQASVTENKSVFQDRLKDEREALLESIAGVQKTLDTLSKDFSDYKSQAEKSLTSLESKALSKVDFSEALMEMSFRFNDDKKESASKSKKKKENPSASA